VDKWLRVNRTFLEEEIKEKKEEKDLANNGLARWRSP